ncbi:MAG: 50S ribosomal protein L29 [Rickettsiales bacterium]|jgi:ribosomal protein L29|nr:50S ribosomal protein L29 [Rickettsiales bacterium]
MSKNVETIAQGSEKELRESIVEAKKKLLSFRLGKNSGEFKDLSVFKKTRKSVARLFTRLNERGGRDGSK